MSYAPKRSRPIVKRSRLIIMAKAPQMGRAKTRLAADIGKVHAQRHYRSMLARLLRHIKSPLWQTRIAADPPASLGREPNWRGFDCFAQVPGSLTPRLYQALSFSGPTIVIGTDCPDIKKRDIAAAFKALKRHDMVIGPAQDGGFYLLGIKGKAPSRLFDNVRWSSADTLSGLLKNLSGTVFFLPMRRDIDDGDSLKAYLLANRSSFIGC